MLKEVKSFSHTCHRHNLRNSESLEGDFFRIPSSPHILSRPELEIEGVTGSGKQFRGLTSEKLLKSCERQFPGTGWDSSRGNIYFWNFVLVICVCTSVVAGKKNTHPAWGTTAEGSDEIGETPGGPTIHRSINHSRFYLPSYLIVPFLFFLPSLSSFFPTRPCPRFLRFSNSSITRVFFHFATHPSTRPREIFHPGRGFLPLRWIHRSAVRERVLWQRENSNDRTA